MRQFTCPKAVTHPSTNRARCRATALIETNALPLHQTANLYSHCLSLSTPALWRRRRPPSILVWKWWRCEWEIYSGQSGNRQRGRGRVGSHLGTDLTK